MESVNNGCQVALSHFDTAGELSIRTQIERVFLFETSLKVGFASSITLRDSEVREEVQVRSNRLLKAIGR